MSVLDRFFTSVAALCLLTASASAQTASVSPSPDPARTVLDIEKLRTVEAAKFPSDIPTCDVLIVGGGLGGVAAARAIADHGLTVILTEPTSHLGGQLTAQGDSMPDENRYIEKEPGPGTQRYRELREELRAAYAQIPGLVAGRAQNVGMCWCSRVSGEPSIWEKVITDRLNGLSRNPYGIRRILLRNQILSVSRYPGNGRISYVDFVSLDSGRVTRIGAQYVLDATESGDVLPLAGSPSTVGQEAQPTYKEPDAPPEAHPEWVQSFTYCFAVKWTPPPVSGAPPLPLVTKPDDYDAFKALGEYTLDYDYSNPPHTVTYKVMAAVKGAGGPFWTYRRIIAASSFKNNPAYTQDISVINWRGNDFREESFIGKSSDEQIRVLKQAKAFSQGFLYWLQTECPRDDGSGVGYPEMQPAGDVLGGDGFAPTPYVRESRRLLSVAPLTENDMIPDPARPDPRYGTDFFDSVGCALYAIDIHPAKGEPPHLAQGLPYQIPLGAFIPSSGPPNILPAAKDLGASRLALASARMHPTEWLAGEIAARLADFCLKNKVDPAQVRNTPALLSAFQARLRKDGVPTRWQEILP